MNKQEVLDIAAECGLTDKDLGPGMTDYGNGSEAIFRFAAKIAAKEREACILEIRMHTPRDGHESPGCKRMNRLIDSIRAREQL